MARGANAPVRFWANRVNEVVESVHQRREQAGERLNEATDKASSFTDAVRETLTVGRSAALRRAERIARREGNKDAANAARAAREELGDVSADELPIKGYDSMATPQIAKAVKELDNARDVRTIVNYEEAHKARPSVVSAAQVRLSDLAKEAVGVSE